MIIALVQYDTWTMWAVVAGLFILGQVVEGNFLTPKLVGDSVGLHPVWVMFALLAAGSLFGFTGILLAVPVAATIGVVVRRSEEHTSELQSLMRISYAVFCLQKKTK